MVNAIAFYTESRTTAKKWYSFGHVYTTRRQCTDKRRCVKDSDDDEDAEDERANEDDSDDDKRKSQSLPASSSSLRPSVDVFVSEEERQAQMVS